MPVDQKNILSVFDLDHTLVNVNTSLYFGVYLFKKKILPLKKMASLLFYYFCHKIRILSVAKLHQLAFQKFFLGRSMDDLETLATDFFAESAEKITNFHIFSKLQEAKKNNHYTAILSSSPNFIVSQVAKKFDVDEWQATCYCKDQDGKICGISSNMQGEDKAKVLKQLSLKLNIPCQNVVAYTDSYQDIPLLQIVGKPIAVNPDRILRKKSVKMGWEIMEV